MTQKTRKRPRRTRRTPDAQAAEAKKRPYVRDAAGEGASGRFGAPATIALMVALALFVGFVVGLTVYLIMRLSGWLTALIWEGLGGRLGLAVFPLLACTVGGIVIGAWTLVTGTEIDDLEVVLGRFRRTGSYRLENPPATAVSFLLPLAFGGSVGFEAGITGIIVAACCWVRDKLKMAGLRFAGIADLTVAASVSAIFGSPLAGLAAGYESESDETLATELGSVDDYDMRREAKVALYLAATIGALGGIVLLNFLFGSSEGMPRFEQIGARGTGYLWALVALVAAWVLLLVFHAAKGLASHVSDLLSRREFGAFVRPAACGVILGAVALALPFVLFPGEEQCTELSEVWQGLPWGYLVVTGIVKAAMTPMCIHMGWKGGDLFPCIFAGVAVGFGLAAVTGADPMLMVTVTATAFLSGVTGKPTLALGILALCFPLRGILWMGLAALIGAGLPVWHPFEKKGAGTGAKTAA